VAGGREHEVDFDARVPALYLRADVEAYVGTSAHGNGGRYTYYACSTRYKYAPSSCSASPTASLNFA
jgi:hypothetical protein